MTADTEHISAEDYEKALLELLTHEFPPPFFRVEGTRRGKKFYLSGHSSGERRQVDAAVYRRGADSPVLVADAKRHKRPLDVTAVDHFFGFLDDIGCKVGLLAVPRDTSRGAVRLAAARNISVRVLTVDDAFAARWLDVVREFMPHDWAFHRHLSRAVEMIRQGRSDIVLDEVERVPFEEWSAFVNYAAQNYPAEANDFLSFQLNRHSDFDARIATISWMLESGFMSPSQAWEYRHMFSHSYHGADYLEIIRQYTWDKSLARAIQGDKRAWRAMQEMFGEDFLG